LQLSDQKITKLSLKCNPQKFITKNNATGFMKGSFDQITSSYEDLTKLLPTILEFTNRFAKKLSVFFELVGDAEITAESIDAYSSFKIIN
jgi:hypothetical protein